MTESFDRAAIKARAESQAAAYERMLELGGGVGLLGVRDPEMFEDMLRWDSSTENDHADTVLALLAALDEAERENERLKAAQPPCDGGCNYNSGPEETCSAHGRPVAEVWSIVEQVAAERNAALAQIEQVWAVADKRASDPTRGFGGPPDDMPLSDDYEAFGEFYVAEELRAILSTSPAEALNAHDAEVSAKALEDAAESIRHKQHAESVRQMLHKRAAEFRTEAD